VWHSPIASILDGPGHRVVPWAQRGQSGPRSMTPESPAASGVQPYCHHAQDHDKDTGFKCSAAMSSTAVQPGKGLLRSGQDGLQPPTPCRRGPWRASSSQWRGPGCRLQRALTRSLLFGRAGVIYADAKDTFTGTGRGRGESQPPARRPPTTSTGGPPV